MVKKNKLRNIAALSGVGIGLAVTGQAILAEECESESIPNSIETSPMNELEMTEAVYVDESKEDSAVPEVKTVAEELPVNELVEEKRKSRRSGIGRTGACLECKRDLFWRGSRGKRGDFFRRLYDFIRCFDRSSIGCECRGNL